jgi:hypothetical protein
VLLNKITSFGMENYSIVDEEDEKDSISGISKVMTFLSEISMMLTFIAFLMGMNQSQSSSAVDEENKSTDQTISAQFSNAVPYQVTLSVEADGSQLKIKSNYFDGQKSVEKNLTSTGELISFLKNYPNRKSVVINIESREAYLYLNSVLTTVKTENQPLIKSNKENLQDKNIEKDAEISITVGLPK